MFIIDGHSLLYKAYFAIRGLSTREGMPTNGIFGFAQMLFRVIKETEPHYLIVTFDSEGPTFRKEIYEDYKANRPIMPGDLQLQLPYLDRMLDALKVSRLSKKGYEADDLIATIASQAEKEGWQTRIVSADKDLFQLVNEKTHVLRFSKKQIIEYDPARVEEKMGVPPDKITDLFGLIGDTSDNIPGIKGVGPVTATRLLREFNNMEDILEKTSQINNAKLRDKLRNNAEKARLSKRLATVKSDVPLDVQTKNFRFDFKITPEIETLFEKLEFKTLLASLHNREVKTHHTLQDVEYKVLREKEELETFIKEAKSAELLAIDTETTSTDPMQCRLVGISMSFTPGKAAYIPVGHDPLAAGGKQLSLREVRRLLTPLLESRKLKKCGHNIKYDIKVLHRSGLRLQNITFDTMVASYLLNPAKTNHGLKTIAPEELGIPMRPISDLIGKGKKSITMDKVPIGKASTYACLDADVTLRLADHFEPKLQQSRLLDLFESLEMPLIPVLAKMETTGIAIDVSHFEKLSIETKTRLEEVQSECHELAGHPFNLNSPKQVATVLFDEIGLTPSKKGKTGYSTDVTVLQALADAHPLPGKLLEYRSYEKLLSTYIEALPRQINPETGRVHTSYIQTQAATGRLSSREPNLQNIPVRTPQGRSIRRGFIPGEKGWVLFSADYSQIELRILAHLSGDQALVKAFDEGRDIHRLTAVKIFGGPEDFITDEMREAAKTINFGIIYGMSAHGLAVQLGISRGEAKQFIDHYFRSYHGVRKWIDQTVQEAKEKGYVSTLLGRRRYVPDLTSSNRNIRAAAERIAVNTPIQGSSADMIKKAMISLDSRLKLENSPARLLMQVHDELILEVPENEVDALTPLVTEEMEGALPLDVPIKVGVKTGLNWAEC